jgi:hypothetical protein
MLTNITGMVEMGLSVLDNNSFNMFVEFFRLLGDQSLGLGKSDDKTTESTLSKIDNLIASEKFNVPDTNELDDIIINSGSKKKEHREAYDKILKVVHSMYQYGFTEDDLSISNYDDAAFKPTSVLNEILTHLNTYALPNLQFVSEKLDSSTQRLAALKEVQTKYNEATSGKNRELFDRTSGLNCGNKSCSAFLQEQIELESNIISETKAARKDILGICRIALGFRTISDTSGGKGTFTLFLNTIFNPKKANIEKNEKKRKVTDFSGLGIAGSKYNISVVLLQDPNYKLLESYLKEKNINFYDFVENMYNSKIVPDKIYQVLNVLETARKTANEQLKKVEELSKKNGNLKVQSVAINSNGKSNSDILTDLNKIEHDTKSGENSSSSRSGKSGDLPSAEDDINNTLKYIEDSTNTFFQNIFTAKPRQRGNTSGQNVNPNTTHIETALGNLHKITDRLTAISNKLAQILSNLLEKLNAVLNKIPIKPIPGNGNSGATAPVGNNPKHGDDQKTGDPTEDQTITPPTEETLEHLTTLQALQKFGFLLKFKELFKESQLLAFQNLYALMEKLSIGTVLKTLTAEEVTIINNAYAEIEAEALGDPDDDGPCINPPCDAIRGMFIDPTNPQFIIPSVGSFLSLTEDAIWSESSKQIGLTIMGAKLLEARTAAGAAPIMTTGSLLAEATGSQIVGRVVDGTIQFGESLGKRVVGEVFMPNANRGTIVESFTKFYGFASTYLNLPNNEYKKMADSFQQYQLAQIKRAQQLEADKKEAAQGVQGTVKDYTGIDFIMTPTGPKLRVPGIEKDGSDDKVEQIVEEPDIPLGNYDAANMMFRYVIKNIGNKGKGKGGIRKIFKIFSDLKHEQSWWAKLPLIRNFQTITSFDTGKNDLIELFNRLSEIILSDSDLLEILTGANFVPFDFHGFWTLRKVTDNVSKMTSGLGYTAEEQTRFNKIAKVLMITFGDKLVDICLDDKNINPDVLFLCQAVHATADFDVFTNDPLFSKKLLNHLAKASSANNKDIKDRINRQRERTSAEIEKARQKMIQKDLHKSKGNAYTNQQHNSPQKPVPAATAAAAASEPSDPNKGKSGVSEKCKVSENGIECVITEPGKPPKTEVRPFPSSKPTENSVPPSLTPSVSQTNSPNGVPKSSNAKSSAPSGVPKPANVKPSTANKYDPFNALSSSVSDLLKSSASSGVPRSSNAKSSAPSGVPKSANVKPSSSSKASMPADVK